MKKLFIALLFVPLFVRATPVTITDGLGHTFTVYPITELTNNNSPSNYDVIVWEHTNNEQKYNMTFNQFNYQALNEIETNILFTPANGFFPLGADGGSAPFDISCTITGKFSYGYFNTNGGATNLFLPTFGGISSGGRSVCINPSNCFSVVGTGSGTRSIYGGTMLQTPWIDCNTVSSILLSGAGDTFFNGYYFTNSAATDLLGGQAVFTPSGSFSNKLLILRGGSATWQVATNIFGDFSGLGLLFRITNAPPTPSWGQVCSSTTNSTVNVGKLPAPTATFYITNHP